MPMSIHVIHTNKEKLVEIVVVPLLQLVNILIRLSNDVIYAGKSILVQKGFFITENATTKTMHGRLLNYSSFGHQNFLWHAF